MSAVSPVYITGSYRTGSTLLSRIVDAHPGMAIAYDSVQFMRMVYGAFDPLEERWCDALESVRQRLDERFGVTLDVDAVARAYGAGDGGWAGLYDAVMRSLLHVSGGVRWGEKTNVCWERVPDFLRLFPAGKAVVIVRDPRDVLASFKAFTYEKGLRYLDAAYNCLGSLRAAATFGAALPDASYRTVRYEDLVADPGGTVRGLCDFLEADFDAAMLDAGNFKDNTGATWESNVTGGHRPRTISGGMVGTWSKRLEPAEVAFVELVAGEAMLEHGYALSAPELDAAQWATVGEYLAYPPLRDRYALWSRFRKGFQGFPSDSVPQDALG